MSTRVFPYANDYGMVYVFLLCDVNALLATDEGRASRYVEQVPRLLSSDPI